MGGDFRHDGAAPRLHDDDAGRRKLKQGFAERRSRNVEPFGKLHLVQAHARRKAAGRDAFFDQLAHMLRTRSCFGSHVGCRRISSKLIVVIHIIAVALPLFGAENSQPLKRTRRLPEVGTG